MFQSYLIIHEKVNNVEEVLWRGFLILYLSQFMPVWVAAVVSGVSFGLAHAYQGRAAFDLLRRRPRGGKASAVP